MNNLGDGISGTPGYDPVAPSAVRNTDLHELVQKRPADTPNHPKRPLAQRHSDLSLIFWGVRLATLRAMIQSRLRRLGTRTFTSSSKKKVSRHAKPSQTPLSSAPFSPVPHFSDSFSALSFFGLSLIFRSDRLDGTFPRIETSFPRAGAGH
jgi:hypothetical protein